MKLWPVQALAGSAQSTSEVAQCRCAFMHILNVKRQLIKEIIFQMTDHLITRAANRKKNTQLRKSAIYKLITVWAFSKAWETSPACVQLLKPVQKKGMRSWFCWCCWDWGSVDRGGNGRWFLIVCVHMKQIIKTIINIEDSLFRKSIGALFAFMCCFAVYSIFECTFLGIEQFWLVAVTDRGRTWALVPNVHITGNTIEQRADQTLMGMLVSKN